MIDTDTPLPSASPLILSGDPATRGRGQAALAGDRKEQVRKAVNSRIDQRRALITEADPFLDLQWAFCQDHAAGQLAQMSGIAEGFDLSARDLFNYLHLGVLEDAEALPKTTEEGCSVVARNTEDQGPVLAKNRDYRGDHRALQRVFLETDPAWNGRAIMAVGSLGSPGAFSSGMNSDGLAVVDTRIGWPRPCVGWLRYFLMNEILIRSATVKQALDFIGSVPHLGGGSLALMDASGDAATVALGSGSRITVTNGPAMGIAQTNHYLDQGLSEERNAPDRQPDETNSRGRLARIDGWLSSRQGNPIRVGELAQLMAGHGDGPYPALCRHGGDDGSETISTVLFACASRTLYFCPTNPCDAMWQVCRF